MAGRLEPFPEQGDIDAPDGYAPETPRKRANKRGLIILLSIFALLLVCGVAAYLYLRVWHTSKTKQSGGGTQSVTVPAPSPPPAAAQGDTGSLQYSATGQDLNLTFDYPSNWTAAPESGKDTTDQPITVTSPQTPMTNSAGKSVTGQVTVSVRPASATLSELTSDAAIVALDSVQIGYTKPAASQHQYPYITFVRLKGGTDAADGFDNVYVTGVTKFTKGQALTPDSLGQLDPIISVRLTTCASSCGSPLLVTTTTWQNDPTLAQALSIVQSMQLH